MCQCTSDGNGEDGESVWVEAGDTFREGDIDSKMGITERVRDEKGIAVAVEVRWLFYN